MVSGAVETGQKRRDENETGKTLGFFFALRPACFLGFPILPENRIRHLGEIRVSLFGIVY